MSSIVVKGIHVGDFSLWEFECYPITFATEFSDKFHIEAVPRKLQSEIRAALPDDYINTTQFGGGNYTDGICLMKSSIVVQQVEREYIKPNTDGTCKVPTPFGIAVAYPIGERPTRKNIDCFMRVPSNVELPETHSRNHTTKDGKRYRVMRVIAE